MYIVDCCFCDGRGCKSNWVCCGKHLSRSGECRADCVAEELVPCPECNGIGYFEIN